MYRLVRPLINLIIFLVFLFCFPTFENCDYRRVKYIILSDVHITGEFSSPLVIRMWNDFHLRRMIGEIKSRTDSITFIHAGDLFHEGFFTYTSAERWNRYFERLDFIFQGEKIHSAVGNHDIGFPERVRKENIHMFSKVGYLDHVLNIRNDTFQFVNSIIINSTLQIIPKAICIVHYPVINLPIILSDKLKVCRKLYTGHDHLYKLYGSGIETNLPSFNPLQGSPFGFVILDEDGVETVCFGISEKLFFSSLTICTLLIILTDFTPWDFVPCIVLIVSFLFEGNILAILCIIGYSLCLILPLFSKYKYIPQLFVIPLLIFVYMQMGQIWDWKPEVYCSGSCVEYEVI